MSETDKPKCAGWTRNPGFVSNLPCGNYAINGSNYCRRHDPNIIAAREAAKPRIVRVSLTVGQINRILESLNAHFAGDTSEGDLAWTDEQHDEAVAAHAILGAVGGL